MQEKPKYDCVVMIQVEKKPAESNAEDENPRNQAVFFSAPRIVLLDLFQLSVFIFHLGNPVLLHRRALASHRGANHRHQRHNAAGEKTEIHRLHKC